jgi:hypothetical protein
VVMHMFALRVIDNIVIVRDLAHHDIFLRGDRLFL